MYEKMLLARRVRMALLVVFAIFVAWQQMWLLFWITVGLMALTIWQTKRLREEIAVRTAAENAGIPYGPAANVADEPNIANDSSTGDSAAGDAAKRAKKSKRRNK
ncbi:hypothetical protein [uncultured Corynebacterium sp.]|uniref:hypothetical protein n=1 Tax=uncultured Corynebacterium sp. TaxID=159447 RepID=UPI0025D1FD61|nr:hypothetical protein [uncultured Corynebacterium sp.]